MDATQVLIIAACAFVLGAVITAWIYTGKNLVLENELATCLEENVHLSTIVANFAYQEMSRDLAQIEASKQAHDLLSDDDGVYQWPAGWIDSSNTKSFTTHTDEMLDLFEDH